jgi:hypothetical protein
MDKNDHVRRYEDDFLDPLFDDSFESATRPRHIGRKVAACVGVALLVEVTITGCAPRHEAGNSDNEIHAVVSASTLV